MQKQRTQIANMQYIQQLTLANAGYQNLGIMQTNMDAKELINWGELSRMLSGSRQTVRKNKIPKIHQPFVDDLIEAMNKVIKNRTDNEAGL